MILRRLWFGSQMELGLAVLPLGLALKQQRSWMLLVCASSFSIDPRSYDFVILPSYCNSSWCNHSAVDSIIPTSFNFHEGFDLHEFSIRWSLILNESIFVILVVQFLSLSRFIYRFLYDILLYHVIQCFMHYSLVCLTSNKIAWIYVKRGRPRRN